MQPDGTCDFTVLVLSQGWPCLHHLGLRDQMGRSSISAISGRILSQQPLISGSAGQLEPVASLTWLQSQVACQAYNTKGPRLASSQFA